MIRSPKSSRISAGLIVGVLVGTPVLFGLGLLQACWAGPDARWSEIGFLGAWLATFLIGLNAVDLGTFLKRAICTAAILTLVLPMESLLLLGWGRASTGVTGSVNAGLLLVGALSLLASLRLRGERASDAPTMSGLAPLPAGGPSPLQTTLSVLGALFVASLASALLGLLVAGRPITGVTLGVLVFPIAGLAALFWAILARDIRRCTIRLASMTIALTLMLAGVLW